MELTASATKMVAVVADDWTGGGGCMDVGNVLNCGGSGGDTLRVGVLGHYPIYIYIGKALGGLTIG